MTIFVQLNLCILYDVNIETGLKVKDNLYIHSECSLMSIQTLNSLYSSLNWTNLAWLNILFKSISCALIG